MRNDFLIHSFELFSCLTDFKKQNKPASICIIKMEKILLLPLISGFFLIFLLVTFFVYNICNCFSLWLDGLFNSVIFDENILDENIDENIDELDDENIVRILPRSTPNPTNHNTVTAPAEIICNQPSISPVEKDQQNQYQ